MKKWFDKSKLYVIGAAIGAVGGFLYWNFVGCTSGSCAITSNPIRSTLYGALMGSLLLSLLKTSVKNNNQQNDI
ncbi:DUF6132 family protein [Ferruginibacter lapsinanis]|uniref:DUF6132 family protein n=1 Tax=Ferruginibacter lapsinanis TaxID=563172 RepID=UPI001E49AE02|nr:DUF6132 family protein [Ferruginibacter lapsinanis]UEG50125.1 DUF6132 family protein [Ferruginibacter lapsinanis]